MAKTRFEWDYEAAGDLMLRSEEIANVCEAQAEKMSRAAGVRYVADVRIGKIRANAKGMCRASKYKTKKKRKTGKRRLQPKKMLKKAWSNASGRLK